MNKIAFIFGAGASYPTLPIVNGINLSLKYWGEKLTSLSNTIPKHDKLKNLTFKTSKTKREWYSELGKAMINLADNSERHASIDTYAKKLSITNKYDELDILKNILSAFFVLEQSEKYAHRRYDTFFASILRTSSIPPKNIQIISWNYDNQFEKAFDEYINTDSIQANRAILNMNTPLSFERKSTDSFGIYKINGSANFFNSDGFRYTYDLNLDLPLELNEIEKIEKVLEGYAKAQNIQNYLSGIQFAWEISTLNNDFFDKISSSLVGVTTLVVIGYSFPFFNREVDRKVINSMENLNSVYFQSPDALNIKQRFKAIRNDLEEKDLIPITDVGQFFLPPEL